MKRRKISKRASKKLFKKTGSVIKRINVRSRMSRGGISL